MTGNPTPAARQRITENEFVQGVAALYQGCDYEQETESGYLQEGGPVPRCRA